MEYVKAFLLGGLICAIVQILMDKTKLLPGRIMVSLVVSGGILGLFGWYQPLIDWGGAGATVPLIGFGNSLIKGVKLAVDERGFIGIFEGGLRATSVGITAALVFGYLASLVFEPKMKK